MRSKPKTPRFGQLVIGPPGSGKSTYCRALRAYVRAAGRQCSVVNLDPASEEPIDPRILQEGDNDDEDEHDLEATYFDVDVVTGNDVGGMLADSGMEGAERLHIALFAASELGQNVQFAQLLSTV
ncbi:GPN-loop GTPase 2, partial [Perkinsus olseni]